MKRIPTQTIVAALTCGDWHNHLHTADSTLNSLRRLYEQASLLDTVAIVAAQHPMAETRVRAVCILHCSRNSGTVPVLISCLHDESARVRYHAAYALAHLADSDAIPALAELLRNDPDADTRYRAAYALGCLRERASGHSSDAVTPLIAALTDEKLHVRHSAASALGKLRDPRALDALRALCDDPSPRLRGVARLAVRACESD